MNTPSEFRSLFEAFRDARGAYERLCAKGLGRPDQDLARDLDYLEFHRSGVKLAKLGSAAAIEGAMTLLCQSSTVNGATVRTDLERLWAGMGTWTN